MASGDLTPEEASARYSPMTGFDSLPRLGSEIDIIWCPSSIQVRSSSKCSMPHRPSFANAPRDVSDGIAAGGHFGAIGT
jgi:hypothetical protein